MGLPTTVFYCPRCDKPFPMSPIPAETEEIVKKHVEMQHPDYDPEWFETYAGEFGNGDGST